MRPLITTSVVCYNNLKKCCTQCIKLRFCIVKWTIIGLCIALYFLTRILQIYVLPIASGVILFGVDMKQNIFHEDMIVRLVKNHSVPLDALHSLIQCRKSPGLIRLSNFPEANASEDHLLVTGLESLNRSKLATALHYHGRPFLDKYLPVPWNISDALTWWEGSRAFGTERIDRNDSCVADPGKSLVL